jgi:hypothetical protein
VPSSGPGSTYYALTPLLAALGMLQPDALQAVATALGIVLALIEIQKRTS